MEAVVNFFGRLLGSRKMVFALVTLVAIVLGMFVPENAASYLEYADRIILVLLILTGGIVAEDSLSKFAANRFSIDDIFDAIEEFFNPGDEGEEEDTPPEANG